MRETRANYPNAENTNSDSNRLNIRWRYGIRRHVAVLAVMILSSLVAPASVLKYTGELEVKNIAGPMPSFSVGDKFNFVLSLDDAVTDTDSSLRFGTFSEALLDFSMTRNAGNTGNWNPATATFSSFTTDPFAGGFDTNNDDLPIFSDEFRFSLVANGNAATNTVNMGAFRRLQFWFRNDASFPSTSSAINDTGQGQSISQQLAAGGGQLRLQDFEDTRMVLYFASGGVGLDVIQLNPIPEPSVGLLLIGAGSFLIGSRRRPPQPRDGSTTNTSSNI